jgi:hypothetical protein
MAISAISPISHGVVFVPPLRSTPQVTPQELFATVLQNTISAPPAMSTAALQQAIAPENIVNVLERALLSRFAIDLQGPEINSLTSPVEPSVVTELGAASTLSGSLPFDAGMFQALNLSSRLTSFFNTLDLLGTQMDGEPQIGSTLDFFV